MTRLRQDVAYAFRTFAKAPVIAILVLAIGVGANTAIFSIVNELTGAGVALGVPLAVLVSIACAKVFIGIGGFDGVVVSVATIALAVAATIASAVPARRATRIQPLRALLGGLSPRLSSFR